MARKFHGPVSRLSSPGPWPLLSSTVIRARLLCCHLQACLEDRRSGIYPISGLERIDYVDLVRKVRDTLNLKTPIIRVPYRFFWGLLRAYEMLDSHPPFSAQQLEALATPDDFEVIDWPGIFGVTATPLVEALKDTYYHPQYAKAVFQF